MNNSRHFLFSNKTCRQRALLPSCVTRDVSFSLLHYKFHTAPNPPSRSFCNTNILLYQYVSYSTFLSVVLANSASPSTRSFGYRAGLRAWPLRINGIVPLHSLPWNRHGIVPSPLWHPVNRFSCPISLSLDGGFDHRRRRRCRCTGMYVGAIE